MTSFRYGHCLVIILSRHCNAHTEHHVVYVCLPWAFIAPSYARAYLAVRRVRPSLHVTVTLLTQYDPMITDFLLVTGCQFGVVVTRWSRSTLRRARIPRPTQPQPTATK